MLRFLILCLPLSLSGCTAVLVACGLGAGEKEPADKTGSFDYEVTYEFEGTRKTLRATQICQFAGQECNTGYANMNLWDSRIVGSDDVRFILEETEAGTVFVAIDSCREMMEPGAPAENSDYGREHALFFARNADGTQGELDLNYDQTRIISYKRVRNDEFEHSSPEITPAE